MTKKLRLPHAVDIMAAFELVGCPRKLPTVRNWTSGKISIPTWAVVAIADHTGEDLNTLAREFARRWHAHFWRERGAS